MSQTIRILHGDNLFVVVEVMKERGENSPACIQLIISDKVGVITLQAVKDQRLICLGDLKIRESSAVGQVQFGNNGLHAQARQLRVHFDVDTLVGLDAHHQLVSGNVLENARGHVLELHADLRLLFVQGLACLHDEGDAIPPLVLDVGDQCAESGAARVLGNCVILLV